MKQNESEGKMREMIRLLIILGAVVLAGALSGCRTRTVYVEAPSVYVLHDTVRERALRVDSVMVRDSVYVDGPAVYRERSVWRERRVTDTVYVCRVDTVRETRVAAAPTVGKEAGRRRLPWWVCVIAGALLSWAGVYILRERTS